MTDSMYEKYGGFETVSKIVHGLYEKISESDLLEPYFRGVDMQRHAFMVFNGEITQLIRTAGSGEEFYGQQIAQTFVTEDGTITVHVDATLGAPGEIESVDIPDATITIEIQAQTEDIPVVGDAGC